MSGLRLTAAGGGVALALALGWLAAVAVAGRASEAAHPARWEKEVQAFEAADRTNPPPPHPILFIGSSSIRFWRTLAHDFPGLPVINRGFGGSEMADSVALAERLVLPYQPREIVVYAGDNDVAAGKAPQQILADFQAFVAKVHHWFPATRILYLAIKPSPSRWRLAAQIRATNSLVAAAAKRSPGVEFIDVFTPMLRPDGQPRAELFRPDMLHMNAAGYALWTRLLRPHLE